MVLINQRLLFWKEFWINFRKIRCGLNNLGTMRPHIIRLKFSSSFPQAEFSDARFRVGMRTPRKCVWNHVANLLRFDWLARHHYAEQRCGGGHVTATAAAG